MKKIVVLTGSPREDGNSSRLADSFTAAARERGLEVVRYDLAALNVAGCRACGKCYSAGTPCIQEDDFNAIARAIEGADGLVLASPVYWYSFSAQMKAAIDRFFCFFVGGRDFSGRKCALLGCCQSVNKDTFTGMRFVYEKTIALLKGESVGEVLIPGVLSPGDVDRTEGLKLAAALADRFL